jgi:hypothetical protein
LLEVYLLTRKTVLSGSLYIRAANDQAP